MERRISAILVADMVGFSRLTELDEPGTLARQKRHRLDLIDPTIKQFHGNIVKLTGDGMIAEFGSVVEAVQCAVSIQSEMEVREKDQPEDRRIWYRIAVNLGDVVFDDGDIYGDGVNIAARLEALAEPGGVVVSGTAYDLLKSHVDVGYLSMGEKQLKNISAPVRVYQITKNQNAPTMQTRRRYRIAVPLLAAMLIVAGGLIWWWQLQPDFTPADPGNFAFALPEKPSIAVAPFADLTGDPGQSRLAEGFSASLISSLTTSPDLVVISMNSLSDMQGASVGEIAERYAVRYVLKGTLQSEQGALRISAQLLDAIDGRLIWADRWDRSAENIFNVQDEISYQIFEELQVQLTLGEEVRTMHDKLGSPENFRDWLRGREAYAEWTRESNETASRIWGAIYDRDPNLAGPNELMGQLYFQKFALGMGGDPTAMMRRSRRYIERAIEIGTDGQAYAYLALLQYYSQQPLESYANAEKALELNPGDPFVLMHAGHVFAVGSQLDRGIELMQRGLRLQPYHPPSFVGDLALSLFQANRIDEAQEIALGVVKSNPNDVRTILKCLGVLTVIAVEQGNMEQARAYVARMLETNSKASRSYFLQRFGMMTYYDQAGIHRYLTTLQKAGLP